MLAVHECPSPYLICKGLRFAEGVKYLKKILNNFGWLQGVITWKRLSKSYDQVQALIESEISSKEFRKNWARLIQKIYPVKFPKANPIEQGK